MENDSKLTVTYAALGHLLMHMFAAFYFVIVLAIEDDWKLSYDELLNLWFLGSLLVGLGALPAGWISDRCCLLYTSPSPRDMRRSRMPSSA